MPEVTCINCAKSIVVQPWRVKTFKFCCRSCWAIYTNRGVPKSESCKAKLSAFMKTRIGKLGHNYRTGFTKRADGYIINNAASKHEHRRVMEEHICRALCSDEIVHHIDGNKSNNLIENLELTTREKHLGITYLTTCEVTK